MSTHHAVLYCATDYTEVPALASLDVSSPDLRIVREAALSIGTVRSLIEEAYRRPLRDPVRQFVIIAGSIAPEAQQALLKILEEPPETTRFVLVLPHAQGLLPTVLSRLSLEAFEGSASGPTDAFTSFLAATYGERIDEVARRAKNKDEAWMEAIFAGVTVYAREKRKDDALGRSLLTALTYKGQRGASRKMLLEDLALLLPVKGSS